MMLAQSARLEAACCGNTSAGFTTASRQMVGPEERYEDGHNPLDLDFFFRSMNSAMQAYCEQ
jgi:hypothetical protein